MSPGFDDDFQAEMDLQSLIQAEDIQKDSARMSRARTFAEQRAEKASGAVGKIFGERERRPFNGAVKNGFASKKK